MDVVKGWRNVPSKWKGASLAIGNFDGVHRGHQKVLEAAKAAGDIWGVMAFEPHPRKFFQPELPLFRLTPLPRKLELFALYGCDFAAIIPFDAELASLTAEDFVREVLIEGFAIRHAAVGYDFFFGKGRSGNPGILRDMGERFGFGVTVVIPQGRAGEIFSSTRVRELLAEGEVKAAGEMLGHWWRVSGQVREGAGRGAGLGFPTANIALDEGQSLKHGIYAVRVYFDGEAVDGAAYLGTRPTFDSGPPVLETYLFGFDGNLYGKSIDVDFIAFVRGDAKFRSAESLSAQMKADCAKAQNILDAAPAFPNVC